MFQTVTRFVLGRPRLFATLAVLAFVIALNLVHGGAVGTAAAGNWSGGGGSLVGSGP